MKNVKKHIGVLVGTLAVTTIVQGGDGSPSEISDNYGDSVISSGLPQTNNQQNTNNMSAFQPTRANYVVINNTSLEQPMPRWLQPNQTQTAERQVDIATIQVQQNNALLTQKRFIISNNGFATPFEAIHEFLSNDMFENPQDLNELERQIHNLNSNNP